MLRCRAAAALHTSALRLRIYTRTGDKGQSSLFSGERRSKDDAVFEALGATDELSSTLGLAREFASEANIALDEQLQEIQCLLQDIGANIATPRNASSEQRLERTDFDASGVHVRTLESWIDQYDATLPPLRNFILPSGGRTASTLHMARSICRRAERRVVPLVATGAASGAVSMYLNRLSDYLFTAARHATHTEQRPDTVYRRRDA